MIFGFDSDQCATSCTSANTCVRVLPVSFQVLIWKFGRVSVVGASVSWASVEWASVVDALVDWASVVDDDDSGGLVDDKVERDDDGESLAAWATVVYDEVERDDDGRRPVDGVSLFDILLFDGPSDKSSV